MAGEGFLPLGLVGSVALHGLIIAAMLFTFGHRLDIVDESVPVVPVDLVTLSNKTNVMAMVKQAPKIAPEPKPAPPVPQPTQAPPSAQEDEDAPPPPEQAASEPAIRKPAPPPVPAVRPQEKPKEEKKNFDIDNVLALLNHDTPQAARTNARVGNRNVRGLGEQNAMTADLVTLLNSQIKQCWSPPVGAPNAQDLVVDFDVTLNPDGSVQRVTQLSGQSSSPYFAAAVAAARRAILTCEPYKLPADRYSQWQEINPLHFDPRQMMGD
jgi:outer membrane biosynthesis protein TonB